MLKPLPKTRHITFKKREVPVYYEIENKLMDELGVNYSDLHKLAVRNLHNSHQQSKIQLV